MFVDVSKVSDGFQAMQALPRVYSGGYDPANLSRGPMIASGKSRCGTVVEFPPRSGARPGRSRKPAQSSNRGDVIRLDLYAARPRILRTAHDVWISTRTTHPAGILA